MKITSVIALVCFFLFTYPLKAQTSPEEKIAYFFKNLMSVGYEKSIEEFLSDDFLLYKDNIPELKDQFKTIVEQKGTLNGYELISKDSYGESLVAYKYLCKFDNGPMFGKFTFYRPKNRWIIYSFSINESLE